MSNNQRTIIFDGICNFCNGAINFIIKRDKNKIYKFAAMQSEAGKGIMAPIMKENNANLIGVETLLLIKDGKTYIKTEAVFEIIKDLSGGWKYLSILRIVPLSLRDWLYTKFAINRYNLFGIRNECIIPDEEIRKRFL